MTLDNLMNELNPKHDLQKNSWNTGEDSYKGDFYDWGLYIIKSAKTIARGGILGGIAGALIGGIYSTSTGDNALASINDGTSLGLRIGVIIDFHQYQARFWIGKIKSNIQRGTAAWKNIINAYKNDTEC